MTLSKKISKRILLILFSAMLISGVSYIIQAYFSFKREILMSARNSFGYFPGDPHPGHA